MNPETLYNDIPFLGEASGRSPFERVGRPIVPADQFRVMTPPRSNGFGYSPPPGGHSIDAIRARRARLETLTSKIKLPPIVTTGGDVEPPPPDPPSSAISIRSGSGDSRERWTSASLRPSSTKGHPTVPLVPYHNPLPDITREKLVEEEEPIPGTGLDSPPPPTEEDAFKVSKWVEQLPDKAKEDEGNENLEEKESPKDDIVENLEDGNEFSTGRSVFGGALSGKLKSGGQASNISSLHGPKPVNDDIVENLMDRDTKKVETMSMEVPDLESNINSSKGVDHLFTVTRDKESQDEGQHLAETELPVQDIEIEGDDKDELKMIDNPEQSTEENSADSGTQEEDEIQWQKADSIFTVSPASLENKVLDFEEEKDISSENNHNDIGAEAGENTEVETIVTDITQMSGDKPNDSSEDQGPELEGANTETKNIGNVDEPDKETQLDDVINFSENQVEDLTGANSETKDHGNNEENGMNNLPNRVISFSDNQGVELTDLNSDSKNQGNNEENGMNNLPNRVISFSEDPGGELTDLNSDSKNQGSNEENGMNNLPNRVISFSENQGVELTDLDSDSKNQGNDKENERNTLSDNVIGFSEDQGVELTDLNSDSKNQGNDEENGMNALSDKVISFSEDQGVELTDLNLDSKNQGNDNGNEGNALSDKVISFSEDQGVELTDLNLDSRNQGNDNENEGNALSDKVISFSEDLGVELTDLNLDSKNQGNDNEKEGNTLSDKVISFSEDPGGELTDLNSESKNQGNDNENDGNMALNKLINSQEQELRSGDMISGTKDQGGEEETNDTNLSENNELTSGIVDLEASNPGDNGQIVEELHSGSKSPIQDIESIKSNPIENPSMQNPSSRPGSVQLGKDSSLKNEADIPEDLKFLEKDADDSESLNEDTDFITTISPDNSRSGTAEQNEGDLGDPEQKSPAPIKEMGSVSDIKSSDVSETKEKASLDESIKTSDIIETGLDNKDEDDDNIWDL